MKINRRSLLSSFLKAIGCAPVIAVAEGQSSNAADSVISEGAMPSGHSDTEVHSQLECNRVEYKYDFSGSGESRSEQILEICEKRECYYDSQGRLVREILWSKPQS